ncbi:MAG: glycosyltransferase [Undibacterium sp.]|nr:glycosyltransferase [Undibacterium sp.]
MIHLAIISHGHEDLLIASRLGHLLDERVRLKIWVKDNKPSEKLNNFCREQGIFYTDAQAGLGFGHNNNVLFELIQQQVGYQADDIFVVMNPDVSIAPEMLYALVDQMRASRHTIATLNLFRDPAFTVADTNIRHFPGMRSLIGMPLNNSFSETYDKERLALSINEVEVEWASGAFLAFTAEHYIKLGGFDPSYFMYFEDVDICYRSRKYLGQAVYYYPQLKAVHTAAHKNRNLSSPHARWFFTSFFKFLWRRYLRISAPYPQKQAANR